jgi:hypothetical protein
LRKHKSAALTKLGQISYAIPGDNGHLLMFWGAGRATKLQRASASPHGGAPAAPALNDFLAFARRRLRRVRHVPRRQFAPYLMEIKFRYEHGREDIFDTLASAIAQLVPNR